MPTSMRALVKVIVLCLLLVPAAAFPAGKGLTVKGVRFSSYSAFTRIVFEVDAAAPYVVTRASDNKSLTLTAFEGPLSLKAALPAIRDGVVSGVELREVAGKNYLTVRFDLSAGEVKDFVLRGPDRIVLDISRGTTPASAVPQPDRQIVVVLDPGHGGRDGGIVTAQGYEKTATLELVLAVRGILIKNPRLKVLLTRDRDQLLSVDERATTANAANAAVFVSVHAAPGMGGRAYIQDLSDDMGVQFAQPASGDFLGFESGSEQQEMAWGRQQAAYTRQSGALGRMLAHHLSGSTAAESVQAPLVGLGAVDSVAALVEVGMAQDRMQAAEQIAGGIEQYVKESR